MRLSGLLLLLSACAAGPTSTEPLEARAVRGAGESGLMVWSFEFTNRTADVIKLLEIKIGYGGSLESVGGYAEMAHATDENKSTIDAGETLHILRKESSRPDDLEIVVTYRRGDIEERREARAKAKLQ
jgi:hypothetical protein